VRLQRFLASLGLGSRRACERFITEGRVKVNGRVAELGSSVEPGRDRVLLDGRRLGRPQRRVVVVLHKPKGFLSTCRRGREEGRLVTELVDVGARLFPAGRLDRDSEGLLVLTNDGALALRLTHPRFGKEKEYEAILDRPADKALVRRLVTGVRLADGPARAVQVRRLGHSRLRLVLTEGRKRQVRRMLQASGYEVRGLKRTRIGGLSLGELKPGEYRLLDKTGVERLLS